MCVCDDWPHALFPLFPRIEALHNRGSIVGGPELAWEALIRVTAFCIHHWDDGELRISGSGERDCDEFHDAADRFMLFICKAQQQDGKVSWLQDGRREEIWGLQEKAEGDSDKPCTYRYQSTLKFLEQL
ncbi:hypothetical protein F5B21DRAFT_485396 [Xylaria acuta]|nr:hypothetical protein F5B21DRAFT_485396 [Xylaria acuta]